MRAPRLPELSCFLLCALCAAAAGCAKTTAHGGTDSTTHWLESCEGDDECGGLFCLCGVCTQACGAPGDCDRFGEAAVCSAVAASCEAAAMTCVASSDGGVSGAGGAGGAAGSGNAAAGAGGTAGMSGNGGNAGSAGAGGASSECDVPWYQCRDVCPSQLILDGGVRSFGECSGDCGFVLDISPIIVLDEGSCASVGASVTVHNTGGGTVIYSAMLTTAAWEQAALLSNDLAEARATIPLVTEGGCLDCGESAVSLGDAVADTFRYPFGGPPPGLVEADAFVQALIDQLVLCEGELIVECSSRVPDLADDVCRFEYTGESSMRATCSIDATAETPCRDAVRCLCEAGALAGGLDVEGCVESWLTARGAITFTDACTQSPAEPLRNLSEALTGFANSNGHTVISQTIGCEAAPATY